MYTFRYPKADNKRKLKKEKNRVFFSYSHNTSCLAYLIAHERPECD